MLSRRVSLPKCISPSGRRNSAAPAKSDPSNNSDHQASNHNSSAESLPPTMAASSFLQASDAPGANSTAIKVVVRVRPLSERELTAKSPVVVNVSKTSIQVINPALFTDPTFLDAISTPTVKFSSTSLPVALSVQAVAAANQAGECRSFHFDRCFGVDNAAANETEPFANAYDIDVGTQRPNQELVFEEIGKEIIPSTFQGFNCTVFAYGQTGSGKTHTMVGEKSTTRGKGVIPRVCEALFQGIDARRAKENEAAIELEAAVTAAIESGSPPSVSTCAAKKTVFAVQMSYCEIYKEKVHDLLDSALPTLTPTASFTLLGTTPLNEATAGPAPSSPVGATSSRGKVLKVREHPITGPFVEGLSTRLVNSYEDIADEMLAGDKLRTVAATLMNPVSSRSHAMFTLTLTQTTFDAVTNIPTVKTSKIAMIDLAGSERANVSGTSGDRLKEGAMINKSLTTLGRVIAALSKPSSSTERVPYRDSTLTWLLKESLGGNAKTTMIAMVSPAAENYDETMSTLRYAESAKKVMNRAVVNEDPNARIIRQLRDEIVQLKQQLCKRETEAFYLVENLKETTELPASVQDREDFYREMQGEMGMYKSQVETLLRKQAEQEEQLKKVSRVIRLHGEYPSLLTTKSLTALSSTDVVMCTLREGVCFVGSEEPHVLDVQLPVPSSPETTNPEESGRSPKRTARTTSWAGSFLKRRKSSAGAAAEKSEPASEEGERDASSSRKRSLSRRSDRDENPTEEPTSFVRLVSSPDESDKNDVAARHAVIEVRARNVPPPEDLVADAPDEIEYVVELQPFSAEAAVFVNGHPISVDVRTRVVHGDTIRFGSSHSFSLHIPHVAAMVAKTKAAQVEVPAPDPILEGLVAEANAICDKWRLQMQFATATSSSEDEETETRVLVKKRLTDKHTHIIEWSQEMFLSKIQTLRDLATSLEQSEDDFGLVIEEERSEQESPPKFSVTRDADHASVTSEREPSLNDDSRSTQTRAMPASVSMDGRYSTSVDTVAPAHATTTTHTTAPLVLPTQALSVRLLGHSHVYFSGLGLETLPHGAHDIPLSVPSFDGSGKQVARLLCRLRTVQIAATAGEKKDAEVSGGSMLKRGLSFLSPRSAPATNRSLPQSNRPVHVRIQVVVERVEFLSVATLSEQVSLTLKKWSTLTSENDETPTPVESTAKVSAMRENLSPSVAAVFAFNHSIQFTTTVSSNVGTCENFLSVEMWGYGELTRPRLSAPLPIAAKPHRIELFVSVDVEERDADGLFRPVAVKNDGTLRLHVNQPRRVSLRITQADHGPFVLRDFAIARLSPAFSTRGAANLAIGDGKSVQSLLLPTTANSTSSARSAATTDADELPSFREWLHLFPRSGAEVDPASRSLTVSLRWERGMAQDSDRSELEDAENTRSVFRLAMAFRTTLSPVPIAISKSVVTKLSTTEVSSSQRLAREWESSRTAWWARETSSRSYRLGTWYSVDVVQQPTDEEPNTTTSTEPIEPSDGDVLEPPAFVDLINAHINGLRRLELCFALERVRQEILTRYLTTRVSDEYPLTLERAQECFEQLLETPGAELKAPVVKVLLLGDGAIYLRHKASKEVFLAVEVGDVTGSPDAEESDTIVLTSSAHVTHFVSEPSALAGDATSNGGGEMCGFLMFSTSVQLDESAVAAIVTPNSAALSPSSSASSNPISWARNSLTNRLSWERRWFVLKRPFLYAYKSFARKEQIGVLDVVRCQLVVPSPSSASSSSRRSSLSSVMNRRGSKPEASGGVFPFCFQLVSLSGTKCVVWSLQASTPAELRAWLVAIDPLKIEAREAVVAQTQPEGVAVLTA